MMLLFLFGRRASSGRGAYPGRSLLGRHFPRSAKVTPYFPKESVGIAREKGRGRQMPMVDIGNEKGLGRLFLFKPQKLLKK
ncbi:hypothetical protein DMP10_01335 [Adlercreutzia equolifaciens subsp. celatus DSM 18785]|uniref:Uncharacterized protein n=1 Tax=Adlercreutzia equolifaciens subsp. celatus DSM 18785 TaxID=1121021 RepID=A0A3N0AYF1_9ACTN|nr:hypothetical protein DX904_09595 [Adlercreutzia equolifaciens subsp. celatus]RNL39604.1 hypothetical protein DMP10_01335 [Adlercreutzia equolifaciens subsp. celatus DSM 18785]